MRLGDHASPHPLQRQCHSRDGLCYHASFLAQEFTRPLTRWLMPRTICSEDKGTNREQAITIHASGGLSDDDIEKMIKDAEANAEADNERRELVETKNQGESLLHSTQKSLKEHSDKVDPSTVEVIELAMGPLEDALKGDDAGKIKGAIQNLTEAAMKLGEAIYKAQAAEGGNDDGDAPRDVDDDIIDADFEDMGNNKRK